MKFRYEMKVEGKLACKGITTHCFFENGRPVVIEERFPELWSSSEQWTELHHRCCGQHPVFLGPLLSFAQRLQSPVKTGMLTR